jgi:hypothetical protein
MVDLDMRSAVLDWDPPPNVPTPAEVELADELLHRLEARYFPEEAGSASSHAPG